MTMDDILEIETLKYCYEQGYPIHRHDEIPELFLQSEDTVFTLPSENDYTVGFDEIEKKFKEDLFFVSPNEDSYHTGWQITLPLIWEDKDENGEIIAKGLFPTVGHFVMNLVPDLPFFKPPYQVNATSEMWFDHFFKTKDGWKIKRLQAQFLMGQPIWKWDVENDDTFATRKELRSTMHPYWGKAEK